MTPHEFGERLNKRLRSDDGPANPLTPALLDQLHRYYQLLTKWNETINLTALPLGEWNDQTIDRLLVEPILAARYVPRRRSVVRRRIRRRLPAIPLKILRPAAQLTMVEAKSRKAAFLREAIRELALLGAVVEPEGSEDRRQA